MAVEDSVTATNQEKERENISNSTPHHSCIIAQVRHHISISIIIFFLRKINK
jgi:hypothetical protein